MSENFNESFENPNVAPKKPSEGLALASLICGCVGLVFNPCCLATIAAIVCGLLSLTGRNQGGKTMAIIGLCLGGAEIIFEIIWAVLTVGVSLLF